VIFFEMPLIKKWRIYFDYDFTYIFHFEGSMSIEFEELELACSASFKATERGELYPQIEAIKLDITKSHLYHDDWFSEWWYRQIFDIAKHLF
jgi:hypothetical protein